MKTIVFDIDGTLSLVGDRVKCLQSTPPDWDQFYERCDEDFPNWPVIRTYQSLFATGTGPSMILLTGRRESCRDKTREWLRKHGIYFMDYLLMRPDGDHRPDTIVKPELLKKHNIHPDLVFEDRTSMVRHWRSMKIPCFQVADGNF